MRVALITGGQQGIGLGIAQALHAADWQIVIAAEVPEDAAPVRNALAQLPGAIYAHHDLRDIKTVNHFLDRIQHAVGPISTFVSNAGVPAKVRGDMLDLTPDNYDFAMDINLKGAFFLAQAVARRMLRQPADPYRSMSFVTSVSAALVSVERAEYCVSKAGAAMMVQLFAARLASAGIGVFDLRPGIIDTAMTAGVREKYSERIAAGLVPAGRWGTPEDVGRVVVPLAEGRFAFASGTVVPLDGGLSIPRL